MGSRNDWADLVKQEIAEIQSERQVPLQKIPVGIIDMGEAHSASVADLIAGSKDTSASSLADIRHISDVYGGFTAALEFINEKSPIIANISLAFCSDKFHIMKPGCKDNSTESADLVAIQLLHNSVVVVAAGNHFLDPKSEEAKISETIQPHTIVVGGMDRRGVPSNYTNLSSVVDIAAPTSTSMNGKIAYSRQTDGAGVATKTYNDFGGTSAAAPLVTAALSDAMGILGPLTLSESKSLLKRTAIPTLANELLPNSNGAGMLNSYKMFRVALRMKQAGFPNNRQSTFNNQNFYDFSKEAGALLEAGKKQIKAGDCKNFRKGFESLRKSFLLNPTDEVRDLLAEIYKSLNLVDLSYFYRIKKKEELFELAMARRGLGLTSGGASSPMTDRSIERFLSLLPDAEMQTNEAAKKYYAYDRYRGLRGEYRRLKSQNPPEMFDPELVLHSEIFHKERAEHAQRLMERSKPSLQESLFGSRNENYERYKLMARCHQNFYGFINSNSRTLRTDAVSAEKVYEDFVGSENSESCKELYGSKLNHSDFQDPLQKRIQSIKDGTRKRAIDEYHARIKYLEAELKKIEGN